LRIRQADPRDCIWVTAQVHAYSELQNCVWDKMIDIMEKENEIRCAELQTYEIMNRLMLMYSAMQQAKELRELQSLRAREKHEAETEREKAAADKAAVEEKLRQAEERIRILETVQVPDC